MDRDQRLIAFCQQAVRTPVLRAGTEVTQLMKRKMEDMVSTSAHRQVRQRTGPDCGAADRERPSWMATLTMWM